MTTFQKRNNAGNWQTQSVASIASTPTDAFRFTDIDGPGFLGPIEVPGRGAAYRMRVSMSGTNAQGQSATLESHRVVEGTPQDPYIVDGPPQAYAEVRDYPLSGEKYVGFTLRGYSVLNGAAGLEILVEFFE